MPFTYQGPLTDRPAKTFEDALQKGHQRLGDLREESLDVRTVFETIQELETATQDLEAQEVTWVDLAVYPTDSFFQAIRERLVTPNSIRLAALGKSESIRIEVTFEVEQQYVRRFDDRGWYEGLSEDAVVIRVNVSNSDRLKKARRDRVQSLLHRFHLVLSNNFDNLQAPEPIKAEPAAAHHADWIASERIESQSDDGLFYQFKQAEEGFTGLVIRGSMTHFPSLANAWCECINQLKRIDCCQIRIADSLDALVALVRDVDLHHDHEWSGQHRYGLTLVECGAATHSIMKAIGLNASLYRNALEWDIRWLGNWGVPRSTGTVNDAPKCRYVIRSSKSRPVVILLVA